MMTIQLRIAVGVLAGLVLSSAAAFAQTKPTEKTISASDGKAALNFARQHHPELGELIKRLQKGNPDEYRKAITQLHDTRIRLERFRERSPERFALLLDQWKLDSRLRLLVAQMEMADDPALMGQIDKLLAEKIRNHQQFLEMERNRTRERLNRILEQISELKSDHESAKQKELNTIRRSLGLPVDPKPKTRSKKPPRKSVEVKTQKPLVGGSSDANQQAEQ